MAAYTVLDIPALRAYDVTVTPIIELLYVTSKKSWYAWDPAGNNATYADNGEWLVHSTGNNGLWYPVGIISGTTTPSGATPYDVTYKTVVAGSGEDFNGAIYSNPGGGSSNWRSATFS